MHAPDDIQALLKQFRDTGQIKTIDPTVTQEATRRMKAEMEEVRREYRRRECESEMEAAKLVLTA